MAEKESVYQIIAYAGVNNDELREVIRRGKQSISLCTLDEKNLPCAYKAYGDNYVHVEFADNVIRYVYDQCTGWSVRGVTREDSVGALKALYVKMGGDYAEVAGCVTDLEVLNKISVLYNGKDGARSYGEAVINITENYAGGGSGGTEPYIEYTFNNAGKILTAQLVGFTSIPAEFFQNQTELISVDLSRSPALESINNKAFKGATKLESVTGAPTSLKYIFDSAFYGCSSLVSIDLPSGVESIGAYAFNGCTSLALTSLPSSLTTISSYAFYGCSNLALTSLPSGITEIGGNVFTNCSNLALTSLPSGITAIGTYAFANCSNLALTSLPSGITEIGTYAFSNCSNLALTSLPSGILTIGSNAFSYCTSLALTSLPSGILTIGSNAFYGCSNLAIDTIPQNVSTVGMYAFAHCTSLTNIEIRAYSLSTFVFNGCTGLRKVWLRSSINTIQCSNASQAPFFACSNNLQIYAEPSAKPSGWGTYFNRTGSGGSKIVTVTYNQTTSPF